MRNAIITFFLAAVAVVLIFSIPRFVEIETGLVIQMATTIVAIFPYLHQTIEKARRSSKEGPSGLLVSLQGFGISAPRLLVYSVILMFAALNFGAAVGGVLAIILEAQLSEVAVAMLATTVFISWPLIFLIGRWMGRRSVGHGVVVVVAAAALTRILGSLFDFAVIPPDDFATMFDAEKGIQFFATQFVGGTLIFSAFGLLGYWRGRRQQLSAYLGYLLGQVPDDTRKTIVELAFEEAKRKTHLVSSLGGA